MDVEDLLRENFAARADRVPPPAADLHRSTVEGHRRARRRRAAAVAGGLAVTLVVAGSALTAGVLDDGPPGTNVAESPAVRDLGIYEVPARGSLAGDVGFVEGVQSIEWSAPMGWEGAWLEPEEADRRVLYAGEVPGGERWALVMGRAGFQLLYAWFSGPPDAAGAALQPAGLPGRGGPDVPMSLLEAGEPEPTLVVVALPGDEVEFSPDGSTWESLPTVDGVAVVQVPAPRMFAEAEVRVTRDGAVVDQSHPTFLEHRGIMGGN